ncbi:MAG: DNA polymerase III subunit alpha [Alphaproteobacteria bacterium]
MPHAGFVHLHLHSAYSLAEGALRIKDLVKLCIRNKMPAVAVTDTNNLFGALEFAVEAAKDGIQPIIGCQVNFENDDDQLLLLVQSEQGYRNLCRLISDAYMAGDPAARVRISKDELEKYAGGLLCLTGGAQGSIARHILQHQEEHAEKELLWLKENFPGRLYMEIQRHNLPEEDESEYALIKLAYKHDIPLVATNDCYFAREENYEAHDALLCIADGRYISEEDRRRVTTDHYFKSAGEMKELFEDLPEAIQNTLLIARRCSFLLEAITPILPVYKTAKDRTEFDELKMQAEEGLKWRLEHFAQDKDPKPYQERLEFELNLINEMGFPGYFLIVSDFIVWAKSQNIPVGPGRGSGAGSVVAWALKITDLDPLKWGLLFERFLNPERVDMPDFDIDFCQERRDEVIRYVQNRYGADRVAQIITFGKLQARAVLRDVGRVLQMPYGLVDRIAKMIPNNPAAPLTLKEALAQDKELQAERDKDDTSKKLIDIALQLEGLYRHASTHAAGVVIGDRPLHDLIPLYRDPRSEMPVTQFSMKYVVQAGLVKFDFLGLKTMTVIRKTLDLLEAKGVEIDSLKISLDDAKSYEIMAAGHTVGIFQLESAGMRDALRRIRPTRFEDIIAIGALYRPGPMDSIPLYAEVKNGKKPPEYMHPKLEPVLEETFGFMIYQENVMQAARVLAGYTLGGADLLRRAMGKKIKSEMEEQRERFIEGAKIHNNIPRDHAEEIFFKIDKFAGYGFPKAHAAGYALVTYWTGWLKVNYPLEFMAASMTLDLGNPDKLSVFKQDLDRMNIKLLPPDINKSSAEFVVEGESIRYALAALKGVGEQAMRNIVEERNQNGPYKSLDEFIMRIDAKLLNRRQFEQLSAAGGFDSINPNRAQMVEGADIILKHAHNLKDEKESGQVSLFGSEDGAKLGMPQLPAVKDWDPLERLAREFAAIGFYLTAHPLDSRQRQFENLGIISFAQVQADLHHKGAMRCQMAGVVLKKQEKVSAKGNKYAFLQFSDPTGIFEVTLFSDLLVQCREHLEPGNALILHVDAEARDDQVRLTAQKIQPLEKALEGKIREIQVHMTSPAPAKKIKEFLDIEGRGQAAVALYYHLGDGRIARLQLPGKWSLSAQARNMIRAEAGVKEILEA